MGVEAYRRFEWTPVTTLSAEERTMIALFVRLSVNIYSMDLGQPIDLGDRGRPFDTSGTPIALLELARRQGNLTAVEHLEEDDVLVEYSMSDVWRQEIGCERFVLLRQRRDGKQYAVVVRPDRKRGRGHIPKSAPAVSKAVEFPLIPYPEEDPVGRKLGLEGAGILAYQTGDQMHPPMVDSEALWCDADRWPEAAAEHTRAAATLLGLVPGETVLDIGCGIGGPARLLVDEFDVSVAAIANSERMLQTAAEINQRKAKWRERISLEWHDCQEPYGRSGIDAAWSMNMIYRVPDKAALFRNAASALRAGGRILVEDWMLTETATADDVALMDAHHQAGGIARLNDLRELIEAAGFSIGAEEDLGKIGLTHLPRHCVSQFNEKIRPRLERDFPQSPMSGKQMADQWVAGIEATIELYVAERMTYRRFVATLGESSHAEGGVRS